MNPSPLEQVGYSVPAEIEISFPEKYFPKDARLRVTPALRYASGEDKSESYIYQGEEVLDNERAISYASGGQAKLRFRVPYRDGMQKSALFLLLEELKEGSAKKLPELKVADGVITTGGLATARAARPAFAPDGFERIIREDYDADILFNIQQSGVRSSEINKEDVEEWRYIVQNAQETPNQEVTVEVQAYASPDGKRSLNEKLSADREKSTKRALKSAFRAQEMADIDIDAHYTAEDWEGFRQLLSESNIPDRDLVLRVLEMYPDPEQREREIRNLSTVFSKLADEILPRLRRSRLIANIKIIGKTDEEILQWLEKFPGHLSLTELLHAASLLKTPQEQERTYNIIRRIYPKDYRAYNNLGALAWMRGDAAMARGYFAEAEKLQKNPYTTANLGLIALSEGKMEEARELITLAADKPEVSDLLGLLYLYEGDYPKAVAAFGNAPSQNAAVAQLLLQDYAKARETLKALPQTANTLYLGAILSARMNDLSGLVTHLVEAIAKAPELRYRAQDDLEFRNFRANPNFKAALE